jgi:hypothetical protein
VSTANRKVVHEVSANHYDGVLRQRCLWRPHGELDGPLVRTAAWCSPQYESTLGAAVAQQPVDGKIIVAVD